MLLEVLADAERAPGAGEHHAAHGRVVGDLRARSSSSGSLVATSRLFIASGRLRVIVATPSVTSSRTGASVGSRGVAEVVMGAVCPTATGVRVPCGADHVRDGG